MKITKGVMVVKDGKGWGETYADGYATCYGWIDLEDAPIHNQEFCTSVTSVTYKDSPHVDELKKGKLVHVVKTITVEIVDEL